MYDAKGKRSRWNPMTLSGWAMWEGVPILTLSDGTSMRTMLTTLDYSMPPLSGDMAASSGASGISLYDDRGQLLATLGLDENATNVDLSEEKDRVLATLCKLRRDMQLVLFGKTGVEAPPCAILHVAPQYLELTLYDKKGEDRTTLALNLFL